VGPDYHRPPVLAHAPLPSAFGDPGVAGNDSWKTAEPAAHLPRGSWWDVYGDAELNRLESLAAAANQQVALATAHYNQARATLRVAQADQFPQLSGTSSATRDRTSTHASSVSRGNTLTQMSVAGDATWELDLWGRVRREVEGARAGLQASADDLQSVKLTIEAEVARDYFLLKSLDAQAGLVAHTIDAYQRAVDLTRNRRKAGVATDLDVAQADTQLKSTRAQMPALDLQRAQLRHALAVLCGEPATTFAMTAGTDVATNLPVVPMSVPSEWLERRPDIAAAERSMASANASVGVAAAAFYPRVVLNASGGFQSINSADWFTWPSRLWAIGPSLQVPLFTGGRNRAQLASARAAYDAAVATYRQTVLAAFQDVEDQLAAHQLLSRQLEEEQAALAVARRALEISNNRYKAGVEQYLEVITSQTAALSHEKTVLQLAGQRLAATVGLIKALGAGWQAGPQTPGQVSRR
jgi:NodT family efflux transporter outer membrane factor (OMF) lipoprotein